MDPATKTPQGARATDGVVEALSTLAALLDRTINEVKGLENPTSENVARWIWLRLEEALPLSRVLVRETCTSGCVYEGDGH